MPGGIKEDFKAIDNFLDKATKIDTFANPDTIYDLFNIKKNDSYSDIKAKIDKFVKDYGGNPAVKFKDIAGNVPNIATTIRRVLKEHKREYDEYLKENHPKIKKLLEYFQTSTKYDHILDANERDTLIKEAGASGLRESEIYPLIDKWKKKYHVKEVEKSSPGSTTTVIPFDTLLNKTYYEFLGLSEDVEYSQIKEVYDREYKKYNTVRDKKRAEARWVVVSEAWECLKDAAKRREYDEKLRRERETGFTREGDPRLEILDESGQEKRSFDFKNMRLGAASSITLTVKNGGGGTLDAKIKTNRSWLTVDTKRIHQSKLPQRITIIVDPRKDKIKNTFSSADKGVIEISYQRDSYIELERISVEFSIELPAEALKRFRFVMVPPIFIIGGVIGSVSQAVGVLGEIGVNILDIGIFAFPIYFGLKAKEGEKLATGCATFIGLAILVLALAYLLLAVSPEIGDAYGDSFITVAIIFSFIFSVLSKKLFSYRKSIIAKAWVTAGVMASVAILIGILA